MNIQCSEINTSSKNHYLVSSDITGLDTIKFETDSERDVALEEIGIDYIKDYFGLQDIEE